MPICREDKIRLEAIVTGLRKAKKIVEENAGDVDAVIAALNRSIAETQELVAKLNEDYVDQRISDVCTMLETRSPQQE